MHYLEGRWPDLMPDLAFDGQGWCCQENIDLFHQFLNKDTKLVLELGAWLGLSTRHLLQLAPNAKVLTIDTWLGSKEHFKMPEVVNKLPILYDQFLRNCWEYKDRLIPIRGDTRSVMLELIKLGIEPDLIYVDASHETLDVYMDIAQSRILRPKIVMGDDWTWDSVRNAVVQYCDDHHITDKLHHNKICWWIEQ